MNRRILLVAGSCLAASVLSACSEKKPPNPRERPLVEFYVGQAETPVGRISEHEYREELARTRLSREDSLEASPLPAKLSHAVLERMIDRSLLLLEADRLDVKSSTVALARQMDVMVNALSERETRKRLIDTFQTKEDLRAATETRLRIGALLRTHAHKGVKVAEEEIKAAWDALPEKERMMPKLVRASQILVRTEEEGRNVVKALKKGADFADLARKMSVSPESKKGGDLGWLEKGVMPKVFDEVAFSIKPGQTSRLTPSEYGFHVFKVFEVRPEEALTYESTKERLASKILHKKLQDAEARFVENLRSRYRVVKNESALAAVK